jgi:NADH-quinone oxidoreductase subunit C
VTPEEIIAAAGGGLPAGVRCEADHLGVVLQVPPGDWLAALAFARERLDCDFFDWLSAVDEADPGRTAGGDGAGGGTDAADAGLSVVAHLYSLAGRHHVLVRTVLPRAAARLPTATGVYRGAAWHERETREMFGIAFDGHPHPAPLLLPDGFEGHPLRKDFVLAARAARQWPGAKEPGDRDVPRARRRLPPPGVPEGWQQP